MTIQRIRPYYLSVVLSLCLFSCKKNVLDPALENSVATGGTGTLAMAESTAGCMAYTGTDFTAGSLTTAIVPSAQLKNLACSLNNNPIIVSNNPEIVVNEGWLFKSTSLAGGAVPVSGNFNFYLYQDNRSGKNLYMHLFIVNPSTTSSITVSGKGNMFTSNQYSGFNGHGFGPSYKVASNWMSNTYSTANFSNITVAKSSSTSQSYYDAAIVSFPASRTIDGRFEFTVSGNCYVYAVVSVSSKASTAFAKGLSTRSIGTYNGASNFKPETSSTFGRECGLYTNSGWSGSTDITIPATPGYMGLCLNTAAKYTISGTTQYFQDQNAPMIARIDSASTRTYGNYGHYYNISLNLNNTQTYTKQVRVWLATKQAGSTAASFWFHAPVRVDGITNEVFLTGTSPKQELKNYNIPAGGTTTCTVQFYIPGLISTDQQLIVEVMN